MYSSIWATKALRTNWAAIRTHKYHPGLVQGGLLTLTATLGGIGSPEHLLAIDSSSLIKDPVSLDAEESIHVAEQSGHLWLDHAVSASGDVEIHVLDGGLFDASISLSFIFKIPSKTGRQHRQPASPNRPGPR